MILLTTSLASFLTPFLSSTISFGVPKIGEYFLLSFYDAALLPLIILIPLAAFMLLFGKISDSIGRIKFFRIGLIVIFLSAVSSFYSRNFFELLFSLLALGIGAALIGTNSTAIVGFAFAEKGRGLALGVNAMAVYLGLTLAPFLGGFLIEFFGWRSIFLATFPIPILSLLISFSSMSGLEPKVPRVKLNLLGSVLFAAMMILATTYLSFGYLLGFLRAFPLAALSVLFLIFFLIDEKKSRSPVVPFNLLKGNRTFVASNVTAFLNYAATFSVVFVFSIYLQVIMQISPFQSGLLLLPEPIFMVVLSPVSGKLSDSIGSRTIASIGMAIIGFAFLSFFLTVSPSKIEVIILLAILGIGFAFFSAPNTNSVMGSVDRDSTGIASGFLGTMRFTGQLASIILATFVMSEFMPNSLIVGMFSGIYVHINSQYVSSFIDGFRSVMIISATLSLLGALTSLMRSRTTNPNDRTGISH